MRRREFLRQTAAGAAIAATATRLPEIASAEVRGMKTDSASAFRHHLRECLGGEWPEAPPLKPEIRRVTDREGYRMEWVSYQVEPGDRVAAYLLVPHTAGAKRPAPAVAVWHQHNGQWDLGKSEPAGLAGNPMHHTGVALVKQGYVVLCPDALCFEERQSPDLKGGDYERFEFLRYVVSGKCMAWKNILDMRRAIDYLTSREEVDPGWIGCYGHSMGSTHTWLVGPWEPRLKCLVGNCCLPTYAAIERTHLLHCFPNYIPGLYQYGDTPDIAALIAPRPLLLNFGEKDRGSPVKEVRQGVRLIARAYGRAGAEENFRFAIEPDVGHVLSQTMWQRTRDWFARHLGGPRPRQANPRR